MRVLLALVLSAMLSSVLLACGGDQPAPPNAPTGGGDLADAAPAMPK
jgi:hypothetical protein